MFHCQRIYSSSQSVSTEPGMATYLLQYAEFFWYEQEGQWHPQTKDSSNFVIYMYKYTRDHHIIYSLFVFSKLAMATSLLNMLHSSVRNVCSPFNGTDWTEDNSVQLCDLHLKEHFLSIIYLHYSLSRF